MPIVTKQLLGKVDNSSYPGITVEIQATLNTPANATGPVPVIILFGGGGFPPAAGVAALRRTLARPREDSARAALVRADLPPLAAVADLARQRRRPGRPGSSRFSRKDGATRT